MQTQIDRLMSRYDGTVPGASLLILRDGQAIFRNVIVRYPERRLTVVLLSNRNDPEPYQTARAIAALVLR